MSDDQSFVLEIPLPEPRRDEADHPLHPLAQSMELTRRFAASQVRHDFQPGMLCREKPGIGMMIGRAVLLFFRPLSHDNFEDRAIITARVPELPLSRLDCIVWRLSDDASHIQSYPHCSAFLEPYDPKAP